MQYKEICKSMANLSKTDAGYFQPVVLFAKPVEKTYKELRVYKQEV